MDGNVNIKTVNPHDVLETSGILSSPWLGIISVKKRHYRDNTVH